MRMEEQLLARITPEDRGALFEAAHFLRKAERAWNQIDSSLQSELNARHHDEGSLALCLRRAVQAVDELIEATQGGGPDGCAVSQPRGVAGLPRP